MALVGPTLPSERILIKQRELDKVWEERQIHRAQRGPNPGLDPIDLRFTMRLAQLEQQIAREQVMGRDYRDLPYEELRELAMRSGVPIIVAEQRR